jgi:uncharacterized protein
MGYWRKEQITFLLTTDCSMNCEYCYMPRRQVKEAHRRLDLEFARAGLEDFFSTSSSRFLRFFSPGEPTMAFEEMKAIAEMARDLTGDEVRVELETNGYFGPHVRDWVSENVDVLWISCDGPPHIHDRQRPTAGGGRTSDIVYGNIAHFAQVEEMQSGTRATLGKEDMARQSEVLDFFHSLGVKYVCAAPTYHSPANPTVVTPSLVEFAEHFVPAYFHALDIGMFYQTHLIANFDEEVDFYCQASIPAPRLTPDGYVSCCDWASLGYEYTSGGLQDCLYGRWDPVGKKIDYDEEKIENIRRRRVEYLSRHACRGCPAIKHCAGGCVGKMTAGTDDFFLPTKDWCEAVLYLFERIPVGQGLFPVIHA